MKFFLCGDVMTGRGIDQILGQPGDPRIHEAYARSALDYVRLAENVNGPIPRGVGPEYIWGDALQVLERVEPDARILNLETAVTCSDTWVRKAVNYRMHPANVTCLAAADPDCCVLANNHVLDWGAGGLFETLQTLSAAGLRTAGAGVDQDAAEAPAIVNLGAARRLLIFAIGIESSGIPPDWAATARRPGIALLPDASLTHVERIAARVRAAKQPGDLVVASVHWGSNWGYRIYPDELAFAHALIDEAAIDIFHGHSSHHPKAFEVYHRKLVLFGCGDFINDYEGISAHEEFRGDLGLMYFATLDPTSGDLSSLDLVVTQMKRFQVRQASSADTRWMCSLVERESGRYGVSAKLGSSGHIAVRWSAKHGATHLI